MGAMASIKSWRWIGSIQYMWRKHALQYSDMLAARSVSTATVATVPVFGCSGNPSSAVSSEVLLDSEREAKKSCKLAATSVHEQVHGACCCTEIYLKHDWQKLEVRATKLIMMVAAEFYV